MTQTQAAVLEACETWEKTLTYFKQPRVITIRERMTIERAILREGVGPVLHALLGARFEPKNESFDPADHVSLDRVLLHKNFLRFVGLGARQEARAQRRELAPVAVQNDEPGAPADPERVRALMGKWAKGMLR